MADVAVRVGGRDAALLKAVAAGRCELSPGSWPVLYVDGRACCDAAAGHRLVEAGLLDDPGLLGGRRAARLTPAGDAQVDG
jgi:hypothetical protein